MAEVKKLWTPEKAENEQTKLECLRIAGRVLGQWDCSSASITTVNPDQVLGLAEKMYEWVSSKNRSEK